MEVKFEVTRESYTKSVKALTIYAYKKYSLILVGVAVLFSLFSAEDNKNFDPLSILYKTFFYFIGLFAFSVIVGFLKSYKKLKNALKEIGDKTLVQIFSLNQEGIIITGATSNILTRWFEIKKIYLLPDYLCILLHAKSVISIPKSAFTTKEDEFLFFETAKRSIEQIHNIGKNFLKPNYKWGYLGLIPLIGGVNGFIMLISGISKYKDAKYALIGLAGIIFTVGIYGSMIYYNFGDKPGFGNIKAFFNNQDSHLTQMELNSLVKEVEFYKVQYGVYPDSLQQLSINNEPFDIYDPMIDSKKNVIFNYHKIGNKYTVFPSGIDEIPNTADDIYPTIDTAKIGLIIK